LTMVNDLPVRLAHQPYLRGRIYYKYAQGPFTLLYFLDQNAWPPEPTGMWVSGGGRADIVVRTEGEVDHLAVEAESPIRTVLTVSMGAADIRVPLQPRTVTTFELPVGAGVRYRDGYVYLMSAESSDGFVPHVRDPQSADYRNLGALMRFRPASKGENLGGS